MKRLMFAVIAATLLTIALWVAFQAASPNMHGFAYADRDWNHELALMGNDLPVLLKPADRRRQPCRSGADVDAADACAALRKQDTPPSATPALWASR
jgi:hypothetical protein